MNIQTSEKLKILHARNNLNMRSIFLNTYFAFSYENFSSYFQV